MVIKIYALQFTDEGRKEVDIKLRDSLAEYLLDSDPVPEYEHNLSVKAKGYKNGERWVYPLAIFQEKREAVAFREKIWRDKKGETLKIIPIEIDLN